MTPVSGPEATEMAGRLAGKVGLGVAVTGWALIGRRPSQVHF